MDIQSALKQVIARQNLSEQDMADVMNQIMTGNATPAQIGGFLIGLRMKGPVTQGPDGGCGGGAETHTEQRAQQGDFAGAIGPLAEVFQAPGGGQRHNCQAGCAGQQNQWRCKTLHCPAREGHQSAAGGEPGQRNPGQHRWALAQEQVTGNGSNKP